MGFTQYTLNKSNSISEIEKRLSELGYTVGARFLELLVFREKNFKRKTSLLEILGFIHSTVWLKLFNKKADSLEKNTEKDDECTIYQVGYY